MLCDNECQYLVQTPSSNTGLNSQTVSPRYQSSDEDNATNCIGIGVRVDWLQGTVKFEDEKRLEQLVRHLMTLCEDEMVWERDKGQFKGIQWSHRGYSVKGLKVWWNNPTEDTLLGHALISLPGGILGTLTCKKIWEIAKFLVEVCDFKATRLDIALDDYEKRISSHQVLDACDARNYARFGDFELKRCGNKRRENLGFTIYLGSRKSTKRLRFYDKEAESKKRVKSHRWEGVYTKEKAVIILDKWLMIPEKEFEELSPKFLGQTVLGTVDFVIKDGEKNLSRMARLGWWREFIEVVGGTIQHSLPKVAKPFEASIRWIQKQVAPTLAMIRKVYGLMSYRCWIEEEMMKAEQRFSDEQRAKIAYASEGRSDVVLQDGIMLSDVINEADNSTKDEEQWVWGWYTTDTGINSSWTRAKYIGKAIGGHKVRFSGEPKAKTLPRGYVHFGLSQPKFVPGSAGLRKNIALDVLNLEA